MCSLHKITILYLGKDSSRVQYSEFVDPRIGHVHTGRLEIVKNEALRSVMKFGTKHIEVGKFDKKRVTENLMSAIDQLDMAEIMCVKAVCHVLHR